MCERERELLEGELEGTAMVRGAQAPPSSTGISRAFPPPGMWKAGFDTFLPEPCCFAHILSAVCTPLKQALHPPEDTGCAFMWEFIFHHEEPVHCLLGERYKTTTFFSFFLFFKAADKTD